MAASTPKSKSMKRSAKRSHGKPASKSARQTKTATSKPAAGQTVSFFAGVVKKKLKLKLAHEFGCKVSIATPATAPKGGQFVLHAKALHGNPYDGHTLGAVIADLEKLTGAAVCRGAQAAGRSRQYYICQ